MHIIHEAIIGSKLKGNDTPESDTDTMGIFIARNEDIGGFDWNDSKNTVTTASPDGDDETFYEVRKFFQLAAKSTPAILPFISSHKAICATSIGHKVLDVGEGLISEEWLRKNANYVIGKWESYASSGKEKELIEAYYIGELTARWLVLGRPPVATLENDVLYSQMTFKHFMSLAYKEQQPVLDRLALYIDHVPAHPNLPLKPNMDEAAELLKHIRNNIG